MKEIIETFQTEFKNNLGIGEESCEYVLNNINTHFNPDGVNSKLFLGGSLIIYVESTAACLQDIILTAYNICEKLKLEAALDFELDIQANYIDSHQLDVEISVPINHHYFFSPNEKGNWFPDDKSHILTCQQQEEINDLETVANLNIIEFKANV